MAFQQLPDNRGMIYVPECQGKDKKHPCRDCFACQWCGDERCQVCRQEGCRTKKGNKEKKESG
jgi:hypothetical protein